MESEFRDFREAPRDIRTDSTYARPPTEFHDYRRAPRQSHALPTANPSFDTDLLEEYMSISVGEGGDWQLHADHAFGDRKSGAMNMVRGFMSGLRRFSKVMSTSHIVIGRNTFLHRDLETSRRTFPRYQPERQDSGPKHPVGEFVSGLRRLPKVMSKGRLRDRKSTRQDTLRTLDTAGRNASKTTLPRLQPNSQLGPRLSLDVLGGEATEMPSTERQPDQTLTQSPIAETMNRRESLRNPHLDIDSLHPSSNSGGDELRHDHARARDVTWVSVHTPQTRGDMTSSPSLDHVPTPPESEYMTIEPSPSRPVSPRVRTNDSTDGNRGGRPETRRARFTLSLVQEDSLEHSDEPVAYPRRPWSDYGTLESPLSTSSYRSTQPHSRLSRIRHFVHQVNSLPWVSPRVAADYVPAQSSLSKYSRHRGLKLPVSWYNTRLSRPRPRSLDLLSSMSTESWEEVPSQHSSPKHHVHAHGLGPDTDHHTNPVHPSGQSPFVSPFGLPTPGIIPTLNSPVYVLPQHSSRIPGLPVYLSERPSSPPGSRPTSQHVNPSSWENPQPALVAQPLFVYASGLPPLFTSPSSRTVVADPEAQQARPISTHATPLPTSISPLRGQQPRPVQQAGHAPEEVLQAKRHESLYFFDGNIALLAPKENGANVIFRVHKSILARHSLVFANMFVIHPSQDGETHDGIPVVRMPEDTEQTESLLNALYYPENTVCSSSESKTSLTHHAPLPPDEIRRVLYMATKYKIYHLRRDIIHRLQINWPQSLAQWDLLEAEFSSMDSLSKQDGNEALRVMYTHLDDCYPEPVSAIRIARECDVPSILPAAFYHLSRLSATVDDWNHARGQHHIEGYKPPNPGRRTARWDALPASDLLCLIKGRESLIRAELDLVFSDDCGCYGRNAECVGIKKSGLLEEIYAERSRTVDVLAMLRHYVDRTDYGDQICSACCAFMKGRLCRARQTLWTQLPDLFQLPN